jgi:hypothetical protein
LADASNPPVRTKLLALLLASAFLSLTFPSLAQEAPPAKDPGKLAAHDDHQGLLVAVDPLLKPEDYKARFGKKTPYVAGIVAIDAYFRNDTGTPIQVDLGSGKDPTKSRRKLPIPGMGGGEGKEFDELQGKLRSAALASDILPPHATVHGLLYFDLDGHFEWINSSRFYVPDLKEMGSGKALLFFDVPLATTGS